MSNDLVDETPPIDSSSSNSPPVDLPVWAKDAGGKRAAKLTLWSPFVGLCILIVFMVAAGKRSGEPRFAIASIVVCICCLIWITGIVLGIFALRRGRIEGRKGVFGRAITGMTLNVLFLGLVIGGAVIVVRMESEITRMRDKTAEAEAAKVTEKVGSGEVLQTELVSYADRGFAGQVLEVQKKYQASAAGLTNPPVLDMTLVQKVEDLQAREGAIEDFITASKDLRDFCDNSPEIYRQELLKHKLTPDVRDASLKKFVTSLRGMNPAIVALRESDVRRGEAMLKLAKFLEVNWGKWEYRQETGRIRFQDEKLSGEYHRINQELKDKSAETMRLQTELKKLSGR